MAFLKVFKIFNTIKCDPSFKLFTIEELKAMNVATKEVRDQITKEIIKKDKVIESS